MHFCAAGQRSLKYAGGFTVYIHGPSGRLLGEYTLWGEPIREYVYLNERPLAQIDRTGSGERITYLHTDHLGSPRLGTDSAGGGG